MSVYNRLKIVFLLVIFLLLRKVTLTYASDDFFVDASTTYRISLSGNTTVIHDISLTNKLHNLYATEYAISIGSTKIKNIWSKDGIGYLEPRVQTTNNSTTIQFVFKEKVVGLGQTLDFSVGYEDEDITSKIGKIWEINIPCPDNLSEYRSYSINLIVPVEFEEPVQIIPIPSDITSKIDGTYYRFTDNDLQSRGVSALFGDKQVFAFDLRYTLQNSGPVAKSTDIALPPDTEHQLIIYEKIVPQPQSLRVDEDGNWLASYTLKANEKLEIHAIGHAIIFLSPTDSVENNYKLDNYLQPQNAWQVNDPAIQELAQKLKTPENIYNFVVDTLFYNYNRISEGSRRLGAKAALENPNQSTCMEFTDLFITLARAAKIPARELNGFAYTQNPNLRPLSLRQDILHAWPEYYDKNKRRFIPVDPTWEKTTQGIDYFNRFDLNHIVFAIHGLSSETPYPAGFYKITEVKGKDLIINPSEENPLIDKTVGLKLFTPKLIMGGMSSHGNLEISNLGNVALHKAIIHLQSQGFAILSSTHLQVELLLPYTSKTIPIRFKSSNWITPIQGKLTITVGEQSEELKLTFEPIYLGILHYALAFALGAAIAKTSTKTGSLLLSFANRRDSLYRKSQKS